MKLFKAKADLMCGRYAFFDLEGLRARFGVENELKGFEPTNNAAPGMFLPVVTRNSPTQVNLMKWGLAPDWGGAKKYKLINARAETLDQKPYFRNLLLNQRGIVPANGFYEWQKETKKPFYFRANNNEILALAGLWDQKTFTIITTEANKAVSPIHNRMPVILTREAEEVWLDKKITEATLLKMLLLSAEANTIIAEEKDGFDKF